MSYSKMNIRLKLIITFLGVGLLPMAISNSVSYWQSSTEMARAATEEARLVGTQKADDIVDYLSIEALSLTDLASNPLVAGALLDFSAPFEHTPTVSADWMEKYRSEIQKFYSSTFAPAYMEKTGGRQFSVDEMMSKLDTLSLAAQYDFIAMNPNPLGKKDLMVSPDRSTPYALSHAKYHPFLKDFLNRHALYDLFLVNPEGRIVYSVFKETDFATSLRSGPWTGTGIAAAFEASTKLEAQKVHFEDFATYTPSYEAPASFMSSPIFHNGEFIGSVMIQLPLDKITAIASDREGLGKNGEVLVLGSDSKLRADSYRNVKTHNVAAAFAPDSKVSVVSEAVKKAQAGEEGVISNVSYDGLKTLAFFKSKKFLNTTWYFVTELDESDVYAGLRVLSTSIFVILGIGACFIGLVAYLLGSSISTRLQKIVEALDQSSTEVSDASSQSASSATELSEASTEQAASLQETMASIEEISAMVSQNAESAQKANTAVDANQKSSDEGSRSVDEMLQSIAEIKQTNDEILSQMETSNKEFSEIVKIISEIGTKTNVINEIVFQTKLLSFNASVEAARAGEHGKGFAVVAEEVGNLAQMSGNAAKEITDMLTDSIKKVNDIVEQTRTRVDHLVEVGKDKITMGQSTAQKCRDALTKITANAHAVAAMISEITHASKEQAQGVQEINKAISQLDQVTQQNSAVAQLSSSQAEKLNSESSNLSRAVTELVGFVSGSAGPVTKPARRAAAPPTATSPSSTPSASSKVLQMARPLKKKASPALAPVPAAKKPQATAQVTKKAAGSNEVPSSDDPNFEEF